MKEPGSPAIDESLGCPAWSWVPYFNPDSTIINTKNDVSGISARQRHEIQ